MSARFELLLRRAKSAASAGRANPECAGISDNIGTPRRKTGNLRNDSRDITGQRNWSEACLGGADPISP